MSTPKEKRVFYTVFINGVKHDVTGRKRTPNGYVVLCIKSHPNCDVVLGYVMEHRVVMEMFLNRYLDAKEVVHHKNEVKHDNRIDNLEIMTLAQHTVVHHTGSKRNENSKLKMSQKAKERFSDKQNHPFYKTIDKNEFKKIVKENGPTKAAKYFGVTRKTIYNKIKEFSLEDELIVK